MKSSAGVGKKSCTFVHLRRGGQSLKIRSEFIDMMTLAHWILRILAKGHDAKIKLSQAEHQQGRVVNKLSSIQHKPNKLRLRKRYTVINSSSSEDSDIDIDSAPELKAPSTRQGLKRSKPVNSLGSDEDDTQNNKSADSSRLHGMKRYRLLLTDNEDDDDNNSTTAPCSSGTP